MVADPEQAIAEKLISKMLYIGNNAVLINNDAKYAARYFGFRTFKLALFSTPYPETRGFTYKVEAYLRHWLPLRLGSILMTMDRNAVVMQNIWFPRTEDGWYDDRIFDIIKIYRDYGYRLIDLHPWDKLNAPPAGNHKRYDRNEFEFIFTFANGPDYTYHQYRLPYKPKTVSKSASGNMRKPSVSGTHAGGHAKLNPLGAAQGNIYRFSPSGGREVSRPRIEGGVFPLALAARAIHQYSNPGDTIADFFCGTGTTLVEGLLAGRSVVGFETDEDTFQTACDWVKETINE